MTSGGNNNYLDPNEVNPHTSAASHPSAQEVQQSTQDSNPLVPGHTGVGQQNNSDEKKTEELVLSIGKKLADPTGVWNKKQKPQHPAKKFLLRLISIPLTIVGVALALALLIVIFVTAAVYRTIERIVLSIFYTLEYLITAFMERIISISMTILIIGGGIWIFWEMNPEFRRQVDSKIEAASQFVNKLSGLSIPKIPGFDDIFGMLVDKIDVPDVPTSLTQLIDGSKIPKELEDIASVIQPPEQVEEFAEILLSGGSSSDKIADAMPLLEKSLYQNNKQIRNAAYSSLYKINSATSRKILHDYQGHIKNLSNAVKQKR